jgi:hypothetical protein
VGYLRHNRSATSPLIAIVKKMPYFNTYYCLKFLAQIGLVPL